MSQHKNYTENQQRRSTFATADTYTVRSLTGSVPAPRKAVTLYVGVLYAAKGTSNVTRRLRQGIA